MMFFLLICAYFAYAKLYTFSMVSACAPAPQALKTPSKLRFAFGHFPSFVLYYFWEPLGLWFHGATVGPSYSTKLQIMSRRISWKRHEGGEAKTGKPGPWAQYIRLRPEDTRGVLDIGAWSFSRAQQAPRRRFAEKEIRPKSGIGLEVFQMMFQKTLKSFLFYSEK